MKRITRRVAVAAAVGAVGLAGQLPAQAAPDVTPPQLTTEVVGRFVPGTQLDQFVVDDETFYNVPQRLRMNLADDSGGVYAEVWNYLAGAEPEQLTDFVQADHFDVVSSDYDSQFGGGSFATTNWSVVAKDFSGNATGHAVYGAYVTVTQDDGSQTLEHETGDISVAYTGTWGVGHCGCFAAGTTHKTSQLRAKATIDVNVSANQVKRSVGLVMETAPNRGRAQVYVDGALRGTIDTSAATATHRTIVWATVLGAGSHTIEVVNLATPGRPRIDLDAVVVNAASSF